MKLFLCIGVSISFIFSSIADENQIIGTWAFDLESFKKSPKHKDLLNNDSNRTIKTILNFKLNHIRIIKKDTLIRVYPGDTYIDKLKIKKSDSFDLEMTYGKYNSHFFVKFTQREK